MTHARAAATRMALATPRLNAVLEVESTGVPARTVSECAVYVSLNEESFVNSLP